MSQEGIEGENSSLTAAQQFLDSIDADVGLSTSEDTADTSSDAKKPADAKEIMSFIDEWTSPAANEEPKVSPQPAKVAVQENSGNGWTSWGTSLWSQASAAVKAGTDQINKVTQDSETAKLLEGRVKNIQSFVNKENIGKIGTAVRVCGPCTGGFTKKPACLRKRAPKSYVKWRQYIVGHRSSPTLG